MKYPLRVAIVGGGWAGLSAAVELGAAGASVTLFEAARHLGGRARRIDLHDTALDNGQHLLIGAYRETLRLLHRVGAQPERSLKRIALDLNHPAAAFRLRLPRLPAPLHLLAGLCAAHGASWQEKIAAARFMQALQKSAYRLKTDCTVSALLDRFRQHGALRRHLWEPLCLAALNTAAENASAQIFANVLRDSLGGSRADTDLLLPAVDLETLFPAAAARFIGQHGGTLHLRTRIAALSPLLAAQGGAFDQVILACAPHQAATLLAQHTATQACARELSAYAYEPIATAYLAYPPQVRLPSPLLGLNGREDTALGQWVVDRGQLCGTEGLMAFVLSAHGRWETLADASLCALLHAELETILRRSLPLPRWQKIIREKRATFSCRPALHRPPPRTPLPGLWLAGDYVCADYPATLEGAVRSGVTAARALLAEDRLNE